MTGEDFFWMIFLGWGVLLVFIAFRLDDDED